MYLASFNLQADVENNSQPDSQPASPTPHLSGALQRTFPRKGRQMYAVLLSLQMLSHIFFHGVLSDRGNTLPFSKLWPSNKKAAMYPPIVSAETGAT